MHSTEAITLVVVVGVALALAAHPPVVDAGSSASAAPAPVPLPQLRGVNIHYTHGRPGETAQLAEAFDAARMDFNWASIEKVKGVYNFSAYDVLVDDLTSNGMVPYLILDYANPLYDGGLEPDDAAGRAAFAAYAVAGVKRYAGKGVIWEVQNEPNGGFWKPHPNATAYGLLALATAQAIKAAAPGEIVVAPTTSGIDLGYMQTAFATGVLEWLDGVSCHPYRDVAPETVLNASGSNYPALKALVAGTTQRALPIVSGEWGYTTCSPPSPTCAGAGPLDEATQARYLARRWLADAIAGVPVSIWYDAHDDGPDQSQREQRFGALRNGPYNASNASFPLPPKPSFIAALAAKRLLPRTGQHAYTFAELINGTAWSAQPIAGPLYVARFSNPTAGSRYAAWIAPQHPPKVWENTNARFAVEEADGSVLSVSDMNGAPAGEVTVVGGQVTVAVTDAPVYLVP